ncbi:MotA/TolQ/ExbB proton channel family protein [Rubellicoccus peritrichatus]|uniref:MotA/TolQ/ExbB proton channel family protein n=1 Tax=Rubellicoccus peritrichatus TaxID=3080537 RepID=A0AAQ3LBJ4_9BACT|nr:MotA/TolQ/ExbB proton channel family protein [Puniceicoccus sp. CR14]WOO42711.1 MotA/TolQ/ExbB proton channel family protein [Puniceicoccus sp. CR14]
MVAQFAHLRRFGAFILFSLLASGSLYAQNFDTASKSADADLKDALERLAALRAQIRTERVPLAKELNQLESDVIGLRREVERAQRVRDSQAIGLDALEGEVTRRRDEADYLESLLGEYLRAFESRADVAELPQYDDALLAAKLSMDNPDALQSAKLEALGGVVESALERARTQIGGAGYEGEAVLPDGSLGAGNFTQFGPLVLFSSESGLSGITEPSASLRPALVVFEGGDATAIGQLASQGAATIPVDVTLGDATAIAETRDSLVEQVGKGGLWIYPILAFALLATAVSIFKLFEIFGFKEPHPEVIHELLELIVDGHAGKALEKAEQIPGAFGDMLADAVRYHADDKELLEEVLYEHMLRLQPKLERFLPLIAVTAATSPLLGLLGTVTGMINTFNLITVFGTGDARSLSSGISEALITTEFGLIVAIPALIIHALLQRRSQGIIANMEKMAVAFQNGLPKRASIQEQQAKSGNS